MTASSSARACCRSASSMWPFPVSSSRALLAAVPNAVLMEDRTDTPDFTLVLLLLLGDDRMSDVAVSMGRWVTDKKNGMSVSSEFCQMWREREERKGKLIIENKGEETNKKTKEQTV